MALKCKLCGEILENRSIEEFMKHLTLKHYNEFVDRIESMFFEILE